jgi:flavin-binding protein dodecin
MCNRVFCSGVLGGSSLKPIEDATWNDVEKASQAVYHDVRWLEIVKARDRDDDG